MNHFPCAASGCFMASLRNPDGPRCIRPGCPGALGPAAKAVRALGRDLVEASPDVAASAWWQRAEDLARLADEQAEALRSIRHNADVAARAVANVAQRASAD